MQPINRRSFLETSYLGASIALLGAGTHSAIADESKSPLIPAPKPTKNYRAAAIGWTGHGDFGRYFAAVYIVKKQLAGRRA